ncbi:hypothetical protein IU449_18595 [Nocardia higoensis]|uniref:Uncharacterized protein n=1 Tax=Nocardia higoensis TaxID=228599 RepID=A0ABS0DDJ6_9NOCA|nr:hypothetical protein [Nocardia higoensis]MBF6356529.1 hypothetical protein [Nocardia higoensis]
MTTPAESSPSPGLAEQIDAETKAVVSRLAMLRADLDVLFNLAQGVAMKVDAALPQPVPTGGSLEAIVSLGQAPEAVE